jgi:hypothetical protein
MREGDQRQNILENAVFSEKMKDYAAQLFTYHSTTENNTHTAHCEQLIRVGGI